MKNVHGIILAYHSHPDLGELCKYRAAAALPVCGRYRLIDFALSAMMNAGIFEVDVLMQSGFQSLMEHLNSGRPWNMARNAGGIHFLLEPNEGTYGGASRALESVYSHLKGDVREEYVLITDGDLFANLDLAALVEAHMASGADMTALCTEQFVPGLGHRFVPGEDGVTARELLCSQTSPDARGLTSLQTYIMRWSLLEEMLAWSREGNRLSFHRDALLHFMSEGTRVNIHLHKGYARRIKSVRDYFEVNMDMLDLTKLIQIFPMDRHIATRARSDVSTYYSDTAKVTDSLIADGCMIHGSVERCILFPGVTVEEGCHLRDCIILNDTTIQSYTDLSNVIADKNTSFSSYLNLSGNRQFPLLIPKGSTL